jgi:hypothetical protein
MSVATQPQHLEALGYANEIRIAQAAVYRSVKALPRIEGTQRVAEMLADPDDLVGSIRLDRLLGAIHRHQHRATLRALDRAAMQHGRLDRRVRELSERERLALGRELQR